MLKQFGPWDVDERSAQIQAVGHPLKTLALTLNPIVKLKMLTPQGHRGLPLGVAGTKVRGRLS